MDGWEASTAVTLNVGRFSTFSLVGRNWLEILVMLAQNPHSGYVETPPYLSENASSQLDILS